jgi:hypothetical protein
MNGRRLWGFGVGEMYTFVGKDFVFDGDAGVGYHVVDGVGGCH